MASSLITLSLLLSFSLLSTPITSSPSLSPYLSPIFLKNYNSMSANLRIFTYIPFQPFSFSSPAESLFYKSLLNSPYATHDPDQAHLFFIPFSPDLSTRSLGRLIRTLRTDLPYWNRTLGADHFFLSSAGVGYSSERNVVELKKNAIQVSSFPVPAGKFIPHKDISLPPVSGWVPVNELTEKERVLGFVGYGWVKSLSLVNELIEDPEFVMESEPPLTASSYGEKLAKSDFCLFEYGGGDVSGIGEALRFGCIPVVISGRPIQDLPLMDVIRWQEMAVFIGGDAGIQGVKKVLRGVDDESLARMKRLGAAAAQHFQWNSPPQPLDAFNTVAFQLWVRRHAVRYAERREWAQS
ncbi:probable glycosyltransferase At5g03795 [Benincasa hispida]|uniref:probable glycosyltransferase At5g03795 n=1 Tax=Benincasa hispida TaxID=102211 RepID=UPI0019002C8F|nr:probable glycosyltransferase At5g03795 [Benincasa hispida]